MYTVLIPCKPSLQSQQTVRVHQCSNARVTAHYHRARVGWCCDVMRVCERLQNNTNVGFGLLKHVPKVIINVISINAIDTSRCPLHFCEICSSGGFHLIVPASTTVV